MARCASGPRGASIAYDILNLLYWFEIYNVSLKLPWVPSHIALKSNELVGPLTKIVPRITGTIIDFMSIIVPVIPLLF